MLSHVYQAFLETLLKNIDSKNNSQKEKKDLFMRTVATIYQEHKDECIEWLKKCGNSVVIYGMGCIGEAIYILLKKCSVDVVAVVDRCQITYTEQYIEKPKKIHSIHPDEYVWDKKSIILVTVINDADKVREWALEKVERDERKVVNLEDFISFFIKGMTFTPMGTYPVFGVKA